MVTIKYAVGVAVVGAAAAWWLTVQLKPSPLPLIAPGVLLGAPHPGTLPTTMTVSLQGRYETPPQNRAALQLPTGFRLKSMLVKPGDIVVQGQPIAVLTAGSFGSRVPRSLTLSESEHAEQLSDALGAALTQHETAVQDAEKAYSLAQAEYESAMSTARDQRDRIVKGAWADSLKKVEMEYDNAKDERDKAKLLADRDARALEEGWISRNQASASQRAFEDADRRFEAAETKWSNARKGTGDVDAKAARETYARTEATELAKLARAKEELEAARNGGLAVSGSNRKAVSGGFAAPIAGRLSGNATFKAPIAGTLTKTPDGRLEIVQSSATSTFVVRVSPDLAQRLAKGQAMTFSDGDTGVVSAIGPSVLDTREVILRVSCKKLHQDSSATATIVVKI